MIWPLIFLLVWSAWGTPLADTLQKGDSGFSGSESMQELSSKGQNELGKYKRSSITFVPLLWRMDEQTQSMRSSLTPRLIQAIQSALVMPRFDLNPVPRNLEDHFRTEANLALQGRAGLQSQTLASLLDQTLVSEIRKVLELEMNLRASKLMTEAQRNSFIVDKAKEWGYTDAEVQTVLNSAYIIMPIASQFQLMGYGREYQSSIRIGLMIFKISVRGDEVKSTAMDPLWIDVHGFGTRPEIAEDRMVELCSQNLQSMLRQMPEFKISGRIQNQWWTSLRMNLGFQEGVRQDDKYWIMEQRENAQGQVEKIPVGWALVQNVEAHKAQMRLVAGRASEDMAVEEEARLGTELFFALSKPQAQWENRDSSWKWESPFALRLHSRSNLASSPWSSQLFADFGLGIFPAVAQIPGYEVQSPFGAEISAGLFKRFFPFPYTALSLGSHFSYQYYSMALERSAFSQSMDLESSHLLQFAQMGAEILLSPGFSLLAQARIPLWEFSGAWKDQNSGALWLDQNFQSPVIQSRGPELYLGLNWNPRSLSMNPLQFIQRIL